MDMINVFLNTRLFGEPSCSPEWEPLENLWGATPIDSPATSVSLLLDGDDISDAECCRQLHMQLCYVDLGARVEAPAVTSSLSNYYYDYYISRLENLLISRIHKMKKQKQSGDVS